MPHVVVKVARQAVIAALFILVALLGTASGVLFAYASDLPQVSALDDYAPNTITRVYAANGQVIGEFATQRRIVVGYDDINPLLREAIIATEDATFDKHFGVNVWRVGIAALTDLVQRRRAQGASTLTQQLARNLKDQFGLTSKSEESIAESLERKVKEIVLAIQIEKRYTKKEIFTIYCNQMYLGHGAYGVEAASRLYFQKSNKDLNLEEAALIAGIFQTPERQSPFVDMRRATNRRNVVLQRMADERYITQEQADAAKERPIVTRGQPTQPPGIAPFFVEEVRKHLERQYGAKVLYEKGLTVTTTLDRRCRISRTGRSSRACARTTSATAGAGRRGTCSPSATRSTASRTSDGRGRLPSATSCRPSSSPRRRAAPRSSGWAAIARTSNGRATPGRARSARPRISSDRAIWSTWRSRRSTMRRERRRSRSSRRRLPKARCSSSTTAAARSKR